VRKSRKRYRGHARRAGAEIEFERALLGEDSGERKPWDPRTDRKTLQWCQQIKRALMLALAGECGDDILRDVIIEAVEPIGGAGQILVHVIIPRPNTVDGFARLNARTAILRAIVAQAICRKRVPGLSFVAVPEGGQI
jgi:ribosome-binding factor A